MSLKNIIVTIDKFHSKDKQELINSNSDYITKLFQHNISEDKIFEDALQSYYLDFYESHITYNGFYNFINEFQNKPKILYYITSALKTLKCSAHLQLFENVFKNNNLTNSEIKCREFDQSFHLIQADEYLRDLNYEWIIAHPKLHIVPSSDIKQYVQIHLYESKIEKRHITITKELCNIINEDFIAITAGDRNNIYTRSWYFKTTKSYYYIIEKDHIVTLYNSFTKEIVTQGRLVANKTNDSFVSNLFSKIMA